MPPPTTITAPTGLDSRGAEVALVAAFFAAGLRAGFFAAALPAVFFAAGFLAAAFFVEAFFAGFLKGFPVALLSANFSLF
jgi:hypothetical protein